MSCVYIDYDGDDRNNNNSNTRINNNNNDDGNNIGSYISTVVETPAH